jgi:serine/threonine-protein kinase
MGLLEKLPDDRPPTALAVAEKLDALAAGMSGAPRAALLRAVLREAGVATTGDDDVAQAAPHVARSSPSRAKVQPLEALLALTLLGGTVLQITGRGPTDSAGTGDRPLELRPTKAGGLKVLATPWAEVIVDGQAVDVTPFARAVPLAPGRHFVTLRHPNAQDEHREVTVAPGETVTLDVTMDVTGAASTRSEGEGAKAEGAR